LAVALLARLGTADTIAAALLIGVAVTSSRLGLANPLLLALLITAAIAWRRGLLAGRPRAHVLIAPIVVFAAVSVLSAITSLDPLVSLPALPRLVVFLLVPLAAALIDRVWWRRLTAALAVVTLLLAVWGLIQWLQGANHLQARIHGPMSHYMIYAGWLLLAVLVLVTDLVLNPRRRIWLLLPPTLLGIIALLLSLTRNAWIGLAAGLLLLAAVWRRWLLLAYPVLTLLLWLALPNAVVNRALSTFDLQQSANYDRVCMWISGVQIVRDYPLTGVGPAMLEKIYPLYRRDDAPRWRVPHLHNNFLQLAAERGLPAMAVYLWLLVAFFAVSWRGLPRLAGEERAAAAASLVALLGITVAGLFEYNFWSAPVQYLTLVIMGIAPGMLERGST
jgi:O-antigen ligase